MRKFTIFLLIALMITLFPACSSVSNEISLDKYKTDDLPDGAYYLGEEVSSIYPYDNKIYTLSFGSGDSGYHDEVGYYDIQKMGYTKLYTSEDEGTVSIYINENGIYYIKNHTIYLMDFSGKVKDTIEVEGLDAYEEYYNSIYADGNYIVLNNNYRDTEKKTYEYNIITVDLNTKETNIYPYTKYKDTDSIVNILPTENKNIFYILGNYQTYSFNAENGKMELMIDNAGGYDIDYNPADKRFYYSSGTATLYFGSYSQSGSDRQKTRTIGCDSMYVDMNKAITEAGAEIRDIFFLNTYYTGYDYIVWDRYNHTVCVAAPSVDTGKSITVVSRLPAPTSVLFGGNSENQDELYGHISTSRIDMEYEEEKKVVVKNIVYEYDKFAEKMRVKMLAGDTDYDVVLLEHAGDLLVPLFKYNLFLPLENYESIESGFDKYIDGVRDVMTYNGHIYGIPYYLESRAFYIKDSSVLDSLPVGYTLDDFLNLCSQSGSSRLVDGNNMTKYDIFKNVIKSIIEDGMEKGEISKDTIRDYVTQHKQYMDAGALNQTPPGSGLMKINDGISHGGSSAGKSQHIALRSLPSCNGKNYIDVNSLIYISSVSPNADLAADYLAYMVSDDYVAERYNYDKSLLVKDFDSYFWYSNGGLPEQYKYKKEPLTLYAEGMHGYYQSSIYTKDDKFLVENGADLFYNAAPRLYTYGMDDFLETVYDGLVEGSLTIDEAADKIYTEAKYRLME